MRKLLLILSFIFLIGNVIASCNETQININSASAEELDKLTGIGEIYAERIIENRPFSSLDDLVDVDGIGEKNLEKIKLQGLACVEEEIENSEEENYPVEELESEISEEEIKEDVEKSDVNSKTNEELTPIILNSKSIKSEEDTSNLGKNLAFGGIVTFCVMFGALFLFKARKRKNEFR